MRASEKTRVFGVKPYLEIQSHRVTRLFFAGRPHKMGDYVIIANKVTRCQKSTKHEVRPAVDGLVQRLAAKKSPSHPTLVQVDSLFWGGYYG